MNSSQAGHVTARAGDLPGHICQRKDRNSGGKLDARLWELGLANSARKLSTSSGAPVCLVPPAAVCLEDVLDDLWPADDIAGVFSCRVVDRVEQASAKVYFFCP